MADRYWVGGTANWDGTAGTKWATTSGGAGGASVPTSADAVFFTNLSTGTCTIASGNTGAASINCTGFTGTIAGSAAITVSGSVTLVAGMTYTSTSAFTFNGTGTLTTAGKTFGAVTVNGAGITLTLGDALTTTTITVTAGTFTTANFTVLVTGSTGLSSSNSNVRTINLGSSTITASGTTPVQFSTSTNLTLNAGTSQINCTSTNFTFNGGSLTFNNVSGTRIDPSTSDTTITGTNTFANFTIALKSSSAGLTSYAFSANQTITGTLSVNSGGTNAAFRVFLKSDTLGTTRTLTVGTLSAIDCDFRDITIAGAAAGTAPTRAGDCGGNSGVTFPATKTVYRVGTNTTFVGSSSWATSSGGAGADTNFPLAQDTAVIDNSTTLTGTLNFDATNYNISSINASSRTTAITFNFNTNLTYYGSMAFGSGVTVSGTNTQTFSGRVTMDFTSAGKTITFPITVNPTSAGTFRLLDNTVSSNTVALNSGTLNVNNFDLSCLSFSSPNAARTMAFGTTGSITITSTATATIWSTPFGSNLTVTGTPNIIIASAGSNNPTIAMGGTTEANALSFKFIAGTYTPVLSSGASYRNLSFVGPSTSFAGTLPNVAMDIFGDLTISSGMTLGAGGNAVRFRSTNATARDITSAGKTFDFPIEFTGSGGTFRLLDALTMGSARTLTHTNGTVNLNGFTLTVGTAYTTASGTKNLTFNGGTLICPNASTTAFNNASPTNFTTTAGTGTGTINMTAATAKTFVGGGSTYNCTLNNGGAGALTITGSNTFTTLANSVQPTAFTFTAGTTTTLTNWNINGTSGNLVTIGSATAANHTLSKASGTVNANYLTISRSTATGGASWNAIDSGDAGNNVGWNFGAANQGNFLMLFM